MQSDVICTVLGKSTVKWPSSERFVNRGYLSAHNQRGNCNNESELRNE